MTIQNYAIVDAAGNVTNVIAWDGSSLYNPGNGLQLIQSDTAGIGWMYINGTFTNQMGQ